ncbi:TIGR04283 family arsenosugar biosynthesis glycosyltransferase [Marinobacteraceae bacterium S3BR75-40.1]
MARIRPRISVVIPTLNEASGIAEVLRPLQSWRRAGDEIVVADGGSEDDTRRQCRGLIDCWVTAERGRARQMNAGAAKARGELLLFLHADTRVPGSARAWLLRALHEARVWGRFDVNLTGDRPVFRLIETMINVRSRLSGIATGDQALFVRRDMFAALGGFADQALMEDVSFSSRLNRIARPLCVPEPVVTDSRRWEEQGVWRTVFLMWRLRFDYWRGISPEQLVKRYYPHHG